MRTHIQILAWIYLILGGVYVLGGVLTTLLLAHIFVSEGVVPLPGPGESAQGIGLLVGVPFIAILMGLPLVFAGWGLRAWRQWGRILGIVVSVLCLPLGIYGLIVLLWPGAAREFS